MAVTDEGKGDENRKTVYWCAAHKRYVVPSLRNRIVESRGRLLAMGAVLESLPKLANKRWAGNGDGEEIPNRRAFQRMGLHSANRPLVCKFSASMEEPVNNLDQVYLHPKNHPGITLYMSYGHCACFMCRDIRVTKQQRDGILKMIAQDVVRKPPKQGDKWLGEWAMRHGQVALAMLQEHIGRERQYADR